MSWDVCVYDRRGKILTVLNFTEGGTYPVGGTNQATLNVTYNYSKFYYRELDVRKGLKWLDGKKAKDVRARLRKAVKKLGVERSADYWEATAGNAGYALSILLKWTALDPESTFSVT